MTLLRQDLEDVYQQMKEEAIDEVRGEFEAEITSYIDEIAALKGEILRLRSRLEVP